jgi:hypothetical protein
MDELEAQAGPERLRFQAHAVVADLQDQLGEGLAERISNCAAGDVMMISCIDAIPVPP